MTIIWPYAKAAACVLSFVRLSALLGIRPTVDILAARRLRLIWQNALSVAPANGFVRTERLRFR